MNPIRRIKTGNRFPIGRADTFPMNTVKSVGVWETKMNTNGEGGNQTYIDPNIPERPPGEENCKYNQQWETRGILMVNDILMALK